MLAAVVGIVALVFIAAVAAPLLAVATALALPLLLAVGIVWAAVRLVL